MNKKLITFLGCAVLLLGLPLFAQQFGNGRCASWIPPCSTCCWPWA